MGGYENSIIIILIFTLGIFIHSQTKFKNKMLCYFLRPNKTRIKKFAPLGARHVRFDKTKFVEQGLYKIDTKCIILEWYTGGVNKIFPVLVPTLDFEWRSPNPRDPSTGDIQWKSPEVEAAGYQGQSYVGLARAFAAQGSGAKRNKLIEMIPLITLGLVVIGLIVGYQFLESLNLQMGAVQQQINLLK